MNELICTGIAHAFIMVVVTLSVGMAILFLFKKHIKVIEGKWLEVNKKQLIIDGEWDKIDCEWREIEKMYSLVNEKTIELIENIKEAKKDGSLVITDHHLQVIHRVEKTILDIQRDRLNENKRPANYKCSRRTDLIT